MEMFAYSLSERTAHTSPRDQRGQKSTGLNISTIHQGGDADVVGQRRAYSYKPLLGVDDNKGT